MQLEIDRTQAPAGVRLLEPDDLRSFEVVVIEGGAGGAGDWPDAVARHEEHAWIRVGALRELAGPAAGPEWEAQFEAMLGFARSRGWLDEEHDAVRGHVERRAG
jgi:hypothetical protein